MRAEEDERQFIKVDTRGADRLQQQQQAYSLRIEAEIMQAVRLKAEEEEIGKSRRRTLTYRSREQRL